MRVLGQRPTRSPYGSRSGSQKTSLPIKNPTNNAGGSLLDTVKLTSGRFVASLAKAVPIGLVAGGAAALGAAAMGTLGGGFAGAFLGGLPTMAALMYGSKGLNDVALTVSNGKLGESSEELSNLNAALIGICAAAGVGAAAFGASPLLAAGLIAGAVCIPATGLSTAGL